MNSRLYVSALALLLTLCTYTAQAMPATPPLASARNPARKKGLFSKFTSLKWPFAAPPTDEQKIADCIKCMSTKYDDPNPRLRPEDWFIYTCTEEKNMKEPTSCGSCLDASIRYTGCNKCNKAIEDFTSTPVTKLRSTPHKCQAIMTEVFNKVRRANWHTRTQVEQRAREAE